MRGRAPRARWSAPASCGSTSPGWPAWSPPCARPTPPGRPSRRRRWRASAASSSASCGTPMPEERVDAVVVGSGFGGSVVAQRLAGEGLAVLVLERGRAYPPGSCPRRPREMRDNFWDPSEGMHGMFDVWSFRHIEALVASGLGGGSLIYANVLIRKDERWFVHDGGPGEGYEDWPVSRAELEPHYERVEPMLGGRPYPLEDPAYADTQKTLAM